MHTSGVAVCHEELLALEEQLANELQQLTQLGVGAARAECLAKVQEMHRRLTRTQQQYRVELRLASESERDFFAAHTAEHERARIQLARSVQMQQTQAPLLHATATATQRTHHVDASGEASMPSLTQATQSNTRESARAVAMATTNAYDVEPVWSPHDVAAADDHESSETRQLAQRIHEVQHEALQSLATTERLIGQAEVVGSDAAHTLLAQTRQIEQTNEQLHEMHGDLQRARSEVRRFVRRMARDRLIIFLTIAIALCVIVIVVLNVVKHYRH